MDLCFIQVTRVASRISLFLSPPASLFTTRLLIGQLGMSGFSSDLRPDATGPGWGMVSLIPGIEKPQRYTDRYHFTVFVVSG